MSAPFPPVATVSTLPAPAAGPVPAPRPQGGWFTQTARLTVWELFLAWRRRAMVITLAALSLAGYLLVNLVIWISWLATSQYPDQQRAVEQTLTFPLAVGVASQYFTGVGTLALIVLAGALVGSEYSYGTHRLSLARGVGRGQLIAAQVIAIALLAFIASAIILALGIVEGAVASAMLGSGQALSISGLGELGGLWIVISLNAFAYSLIAMWLGTLGRSVAAAIAGPLVYIFVEAVATDILSIYKLVPNPDTVTIFISHIPDYLLGYNMTALISLSARAPYGLANPQPQLGWLHALVVIAVYCVLFIGSSYLVFRLRDARE